MHLDSRMSSVILAFSRFDAHLLGYATGTEADCTTGLCCRVGGFNSASPNITLLPAPRYGAYLCDSPYALLTSVLEAIPVLTDTVGTGFDFTIYTGDLVSHDADNELGRWLIFFFSDSIVPTIPQGLCRIHGGTATFKL